MSVQQEKFTEIADAIRDKTGTTDKIKPNDFKNKIDDVYDAGHEAGKQAQYDDFWDIYQNNGNRTNYNGAFYGKGWNNKNFKPKHDIRPNSSDIASMFRETNITGDLKALLEELKVELDTSLVTTFSYSFYNNQFEILPLIDMSNSYAAAYVFANNKNLKEIKIKVAKTTNYNNIFNSCNALVDFEVIGIIGQNGFNVNSSTKLTHDSLISIIDALADYSSSAETYTVTLGTTNLAKLTDIEKAEATQKGWTLV